MKQIIQIKNQERKGLKTNNKEIKKTKNRQKEEQLIS